MKTITIKYQGTTNSKYETYTTQTDNPHAVLSKLHNWMLWDGDCLILPHRVTMVRVTE